METKRLEWHLAILTIRMNCLVDRYQPNLQKESLRSNKEIWWGRVPKSWASLVLNSTPAKWISIRWRICYRILNIFLIIICSKFLRIFKQDNRNTCRSLSTRGLRHLSIWIRSRIGTQISSKILINTNKFGFKISMELRRSAINLTTVLSVPIIRSTESRLWMATSQF